MRNNELRWAKITSSKAYLLIPQGSRKMTPEELKAYKEANPKGRKENIDAGFQVGALTYINEKRAERRLGKTVEDDAYSRAIAWGEFMELFVFNELVDMGYELQSKSTIVHPDYPDIWAGSVDLKGRFENLVAEIKCYQLKNFVYYSDCLLNQDIQRFKIDFPKEYWQIVSNGCIHNAKYGEAIVFCPYESQMPLIRETAANYDGADQGKYKFIVDTPIIDLPCIKDGGYYKNVNKFKFEIPQEDKDYLTSRVIEAGKLITA